MGLEAELGEIIELEIEQWNLKFEDLEKSHLKDLEDLRTIIKKLNNETVIYQSQYLSRYKPKPEKIIEKRYETEKVREILELQIKQWELKFENLEKSHEAELDVLRREIEMRLHKRITPKPILREQLKVLIERKEAIEKENQETIRDTGFLEKELSELKILHEREVSDLSQKLKEKEEKVKTLEKTLEKSQVDTLRAIAEVLKKVDENMVLKKEYEREVELHAVQWE